jgi:hypothetical protein
MGEGWVDFSAMLLTVRAEMLPRPNDPTSPASTTWVVRVVRTRLFGTIRTTRRPPLSLLHQLNRNRSTYKHIQNGVPLPGGPAGF